MRIRNSSIENKHNSLFIYFIVFMVVFLKSYQEYFITYAGVLSGSLIDNISMSLLLLFFSVLFLLLLCFVVTSRFYFTSEKLILMVLIPGCVFNPNIAIFIFTIFLWSLVKSLISIKKYISIMFYIYLVIVTSVLLFYNFGVHRIINEMRFGMVETYGLEHQNLFPTFVFLFSMFFVLMFSKKVVLCIFYLLAVLMIGSYFFTARSFQIGMILALLFYLRSFFPLSKRYAWLPVFLFVITMLIIYYLPTNQFLGMLNLFASNRFYYSYRMLGELGGPLQWLFGSPNRKPPFPLDNSYVAMIYKYGLIVMVYFLYLLKRTMTNLIYEKQNLIVCMICVMCLFSIFENILPRIIFNFVVFFMVTPFFVSNGKVSLSFKQKGQS